ncbi:mannose-6-phosphate isomerase [Erythrobacteraceae bacterium CFH 75059]|nr:mannose-6-phosphate isomerase [Erythrobacteraceae bacterium CFH 75059]
MEKVWGRTHLPPPFNTTSAEPVGEIWFEPPPELETLLAKYLFTSEKLSVQVHPDDARAPEGSRGKEECWLVLAAEPDAVLAIGFTETLPAARIRAAALDGSIEGLLAWHPVRAGDFFYLPAGTVHAIGAGVTIAELQQHSDVTYRLFDYGRPRDLHLDEALAVLTPGPYADPRRCRVRDEETVRLVDGPHFRVTHVSGAADRLVLGSHRGAAIVLPLDGTLSDARGTTVGAGQCGWVDDAAALSASADARYLVFSAC